MGCSGCLECAAGYVNNDIPPGQVMERPDGIGIGAVHLSFPVVALVHDIEPIRKPRPGSEQFALGEGGGYQDQDDDDDNWPVDWLEDIPDTT